MASSSASHCNRVRRSCGRELLYMRGLTQIIASFSRSLVGGPAAKALNTNFAALYDTVDAEPVRPALLATDPAAREVTERLIRDAGARPGQMHSYCDVGFGLPAAGYATYRAPISLERLPACGR